MKLLIPFILFIASLSVSAAPVFKCENMKELPNHDVKSFLFESVEDESQIYTRSLFAKVEIEKASEVESIIANVSIELLSNNKVNIAYEERLYTKAQTGWDGSSPFNKKNWQSSWVADGHILKIANLGAGTSIQCSNNENNPSLQFNTLDINVFGQTKKVIALYGASLPKKINDTGPNYAVKSSSAIKMALSNLELLGIYCSMGNTDEGEDTIQYLTREVNGVNRSTFRAMYPCSNGQSAIFDGVLGDSGVAIYHYQLVFAN